MLGISSRSSVDVKISRGVIDLVAGDGWFRIGSNRLVRTTSIVLDGTVLLLWKYQDKNIYSIDYNNKKKESFEIYTSILLTFL